MRDVGMIAPGKAWTVCFLVGLMSITCSQSRAEGMALDTASLTDACSRAEKSWIGFCDGYIQAAIDLIEFNGTEVCIAGGTTRNQIFEAVYPELKKTSLAKGISD